jgi:hypothetical protein
MLKGHVKESARDIKASWMLEGRLRKAAIMAAFFFEPNSELLYFRITFGASSSTSRTRFARSGRTSESPSALRQVLPELALLVLVALQNRLRCFIQYFPNSLCSFWSRYVLS